ncbi:MAG: hypothetical protein HQK92_07465 [Nitrospirae bacterium]|nr:hypothetical protein [Nitrospirota bacterium]
MLHFFLLILSIAKIPISPAKTVNIDCPMYVITGALAEIAVVVVVDVVYVV